MTDKAVSRLAKAISVLFNPLWIGLIFFIILVSVMPYTRSETSLVLVSGILSTVILPLAIVGMLVKRGLAENMDVPDRRKRLLPFALFSIEYGLFALANAFLHLPVSFQAVMWIVLINTLIYGLITIWWKISIHAAGIAGYLVCIMYFTEMWTWWALLPVVAVAWSRIYLRAHTAAQIAMGILLGTGLTLFQLQFYLPN